MIKAAERLKEIERFKDRISFADVEWLINEVKELREKLRMSVEALKKYQHIAAYAPSNDAFNHYAAREALANIGEVE